MSRFVDQTEGTFIIKDLNAGSGKAQVKLEKDGVNYYVYLSRIAKRIIGKETIELRLYKTQSGSWVIGNPSNKIMDKICRTCGKSMRRYGYYCCSRNYNYKHELRDKRVVEDYFTVTDVNNKSKGKSTVTLVNSASEKFEFHLHDIWSKFPDIYLGRKIKITEVSKSGYHFWIPVTK